MATAVALLASSWALAQGGFEVLSRKALSSAVPRDFYLQGSALLVERRNAVLLESPSGARALAALIVTSGWASRFPHKYAGMLITEGKLAVCGNPLGVGSYAFGVQRPEITNAGAAEFLLYNQAGQEIGACAVRKDLQLKEPRPLQAVVDGPRSARLYVGRYWVELRP